jgi:hypothetical protein
MIGLLVRIWEVLEGWEAEGKRAPRQTFNLFAGSTALVSAEQNTHINRLGFTSK